TDVVADIVEGLEKGQHTALTLLDLTKAFDCVCHKILLDKLHYYGIRGMALELFKSYLYGRQQCVDFENKRSSLQIIKHGVPQGSVLGPVLFIIYTNDLFCNLNPTVTRAYADDTTLLNQQADIVQLHTSIRASEKLAQNWF